MVSLVWCLAALKPAQAVDFERFALVIGNNDYAAAPLVNAVNDARAMAVKLEALGFAVSLSTNATSAQLSESVTAFYHQVNQSDATQTLAVVFYAGHAVQLDRQNYLVATDSLLVSSAEDNRGVSITSQSASLAHSAYGLFPLTTLFAQMTGNPGSHNVLILDACRDNPFESAQLDEGALVKGLAPVKAPTGTLIAYATAPGSVALDGAGDNGTYTYHLLNELDQMVPVEEVFKNVRKKVAYETRRQQIPWEHSSLLSEIYFNPPLNDALPDMVSF
ncbi:hypothetical protein BFC17_09650 [Alteromonas lipolytica]|uniref:Peptidase C14A caspase catalytic domain-containing protein n=2 Tax=Alteromonas lipolytica TaxID=1856405 RepID=A0A1E8FJ34_9ALTE|nr:hypothetical protein BFC17_09650 [Alteromonas lipolytica]